MSTNKKSFLLHIDSLDILDDLTNGQAGVLFKAIKAYQHNDDFPLDSIVKIAFSPFKNQFLRDDEKYIKTCERRAIAGSKGGKQKVANASKCKQEVAKVADSNNKNKNKTKNKSDKEDTSASLVQAEPKRSKFKFSDVDYQCAEWIYSLVINIAPASKKPNFENWANTIRLMRELDKLTHDDISQVFIWANQDQFWSVNILSVAKLREKFPQLQAKMKGVNNGHQSTGRKESSHERIKRENDIKYRGGRQEQGGLVMGANDGHLGRTVGEGEREQPIARLDNQPFIDY
jgi:hypothetical protein